MSAVAYRHHDADNARYLKLAASAVEILGREQAEELVSELARIAGIMASLTEGGYSLENYTAATAGIGAMIASHKNGRALRFADAVETQKSIEKLLKSLPANGRNDAQRQMLSNRLNQIKRILSGHFEPKIQKKAEVKNVKILNDVLNKIPPKLRGEILAALANEKREVNIGNIVRALTANKSERAIAAIGDILVLLAGKKELSKHFGQAITALAESKNSQVIAQVVERLAQNHADVATRTATSVIDAMMKISPELAVQTSALIIEKLAVNSPDVTTKFVIHLADKHQDILKAATLVLADNNKIPAVATVLNVVAEHKPQLTAQLVHAFADKHSDVIKAATLVLVDSGKIPAVTAVLRAMTDIKPELAAQAIAVVAEKNADGARAALAHLAEKQPAAFQKIGAALNAIDPKSPAHAIFDSVAKAPSGFIQTAASPKIEDASQSNVVNFADFKGAAADAVSDKRTAFAPNQAAPILQTVFKTSVGTETEMPSVVDTINGKSATIGPGITDADNNFVSLNEFRQTKDGIVLKEEFSSPLPQHIDPNRLATAEVIQVLPEVKYETTVDHLKFDNDGPQENPTWTPPEVVVPWCCQPENKSQLEGVTDRVTLPTDFQLDVNPITQTDPIAGQNPIAEILEPGPRESPTWTPPEVVVPWCCQPENKSQLEGVTDRVALPSDFQLDVAPITQSDPIAGQNPTATVAQQPEVTPQEIPSWSIPEDVVPWCCRPENKNQLENITERVTLASNFQLEI